LYRPARRGLGLWGGKALRRVERRAGGSASGLGPLGFV